ncbi:SRPBCC family protein [Nostoc sp. MS1]|uniref:SRPBCC family protein n=1 Tax=Nostoc sp. MS1 TaxID=2764711 RepID=UPI001CC5AE02|nr:SRPBCC family protein [Nostoc sp. MS1]
MITRVFNAPRELVWKVWTDPKHVEQWWGPKGFTTRVIEMDLRPGGQWHFVMIGADGTQYPCKGIFQEVVPQERIVATDEFDEGFEKVINVDLPQTMVTTTIFSEEQGKTKLTMVIVHQSADDRRKHEQMGVIAGWNSSFDCLEEFLAKIVVNQGHRLTLTLPSDREIVVERVFNAPRQLVFEAWTQPFHVKRWFGGCSSMTMTLCEIDLRAGGSWRYVLYDSGNGIEHAFSGEYREIVPPERLVATERYEGVADSDHLNTLTLTENDGKTTLHIHIQHSSGEQRDGHLQSGMEVGMNQTLNRLEEILQSI